MREHQSEEGDAGQDLAAALAAKLSPKLEATLVPAIAKRLLPELEALLDQKQEALLAGFREQRDYLNSALGVLEARSGEPTEEELALEKRGETKSSASLEDRLARRVEQSFTTMRRSTSNLRGQDGAFAQGEVEEGEPTSARAVVINFRRFRSVMALCKVYTSLVHLSPTLALAVVVLSEGMLVADVVFFIITSVLFLVHYLRHGVITLANTSALRLGEHVGDDGQRLLDAHSPGIENPLSCLQALTWRKRSHYIMAKGCMVTLVLLNIAVWIYIFLVMTGVVGFDWFTRDEVAYIGILNNLVTIQIVVSSLFSAFVRREMHFVLPARADGDSWDIADDSLASAFSPLLGPPCVYFGSVPAYDDFRIWAGLASKRADQNVSFQNVGRFYPEELGIYALQGRDHAARLARTLSEAKLYDSRRQKFLRRFADESERGDERPSLILQGLPQQDAKRGELYDVDLRRDFPQALGLHLLLYDSHTHLAWVPKRIGQDPQQWVALKKWQHQAALSPQRLGQEEPVWEPDQLFGSTATTDIAYGTYGGFRVFVTFSVNRSSVGKPMADLHEEIRAMKRLGEHPNIASLYTTGLAVDKQPYMATESYEAIGCLLNQFVNHYSLEGYEFPPSLAKRIFQGLISALQLMHERCLLHRGLRTAGVMVTANQEAKLSDLGFVQKTGTKSKLLGSSSAPETCMGAEQGPPVDCWGLGSILHEIYQGHADLMDCSSFPPKKSPGTPSGLRAMEFCLRVAMENLLDFRPSNRWTLQQLKSSQWFGSFNSDADRAEIPTLDVEPRRILRRYVGHAPSIPVCSVVVNGQDDGLLGKTLQELNFEESGVRVLLLVRKSGSCCPARSPARLDTGDRICFGFPANCDTDALLKELLAKLLRHTPEKPPVAWFERASRDAAILVQQSRTAGSIEDALPVGGSIQRLVPFHAEFDCFCFPNHSSRVGKVDIGTLSSMGISVVGIVRGGEWLPFWLPPASIVIEPGDLGLIFRAPRTSGSSVPTLIDDDVDCIMNEQELVKRLAVVHGLNDGGTSSRTSPRTSPRTLSLHTKSDIGNSSV